MNFNCFFPSYQMCLNCFGLVWSLPGSDILGFVVRALFALRADVLSHFPAEVVLGGRPTPWWCSDHQDWDRLSSHGGPVSMITGAMGSRSNRWVVTHAAAVSGIFIKTFKFVLHPSVTINIWLYELGLVFHVAARSLSRAVAQSVRYFDELVRVSQTQLRVIYSR